MSSPEAPSEPSLARFLIAERGALDLAKALDTPVAGSHYAISVLALGQRSRSLFRGFLELQGGSARAAGRTLLRVMVEINILLRFLAKDPEFHTELWLAEGERVALIVLDELHGHTQLATRWELEPVPEDDLVQRREFVTEARNKGREQQVKGVRKTGQVFPSTDQQRKALNEQAADEAYIMGYRVLSTDVHAGARTFDGGEYQTLNDGTMSYSDEPPANRSIGERALAIAMMASTLKLVGTALELPIVDEADEIQRVFVPAQSPDTAPAPTQPATDL
jgi:hypothetical protein